MIYRRQTLPSQPYVASDAFMDRSHYQQSRLHSLRCQDCVFLQQVLLQRSRAVCRMGMWQWHCFSLLLAYFGRRLLMGMQQYQHRQHTGKLQIWVALPGFAEEIYLISDYYCIINIYFTQRLHIHTKELFVFWKRGSFLSYWARF